MRHQPLGIDRVAGEAATDMIVDAALAHPREGENDGIAQLCVAAALPATPHQLEHGRLRELRRLADAAMDGIDLGEELLGGADDDVRRNAAAALRSRELAERLSQSLHVLGHLL